VNLVQTVIDAVPNAELKMAIHELRQLRDEGVLPPGTVRQVAASLVEHAGLSESDALKVAKVELMEAAAWRWAQEEEQAR
jgi:hypothetical protein